MPDLGEGLPDAVIREWHVREGDTVSADQALVTVETAKALVEVPAPWAGTVEKLFAEADETLETGQPLVGFTEAATASVSPTANEKSSDQAADSGTVVGKIEQGSESLAVENRPLSNRPRNTTPAVRALARRLCVDLSGLHPAGARFTEAEVRRAASGRPLPRWDAQPELVSEVAQEIVPEIAPESAKQAVAPGGEKPDPARRAMALAMEKSRNQVCPMTLCDEADISRWKKSTNATLQLLRAIAHAAMAEPNLNAHFHCDRLAPQTPVNIGLAVDAPKGLFVPVLKDIDALSDEQLLEKIQTFKQQASEGAIPQADLQGATIHLSNFGSLGGRFATPVVVPPLVCIVGAGRSFEAVLPHKGKARIRRLLPLSVTADHRAVTGGELARFLQSVKEFLAHPQ
nr:dihydrolipoamide acetyltransferase family protein [Microbulbifer sp. CAU 1566]